tara:strand:+ start:129 stop:932 length:804 start_codon:yes stop_codon:yes gene_type:complete
MLNPRIIPCLLLDNGGLVKTTNFKSPKYIGDPTNAIRTFNEMFVDELIFLDINASKYGQEPNYALIKKLSSECNMPLCYGGGLKSLNQIEKIISYGVEKIAINSAAFIDTNLISEAIKIFGTQSLVLSVDVRRKVNSFKEKYEIFNVCLNKSKLPKLSSHIKKMQGIGVGEIIVNSVDKDGTMSGYDHDLIDFLKPKINVPFTILGGASDYKDFKDLYKKYGLVGMAAGSVFVFQGQYRAVLINYPNKSEKNSLFNCQKSNINISDK